MKNFTNITGTALAPDAGLSPLAMHREAVYQLAEAVEAWRKEMFSAGLKLNVKKHFSLLAAQAQAQTAVEEALATVTQL